MASITFDATAVDTSSRDPIPAGTYEAVVTDSEVRVNRAGNGKGINLTFEIVSGPHKGRRAWKWINFEHPNAEAQRIGQEELARICKAVGIGRLDDTSQLHNLPMMITVTIDRDDPTRNDVKGYRAKGGQVVRTAPAAAPSAGDDPWKR